MKPASFIVLGVAACLVIGCAPQPSPVTTPASTASASPSSDSAPHTATPMAPTPTGWTPSPAASPVSMPELARQDRAILGDNVYRIGAFSVKTRNPCSERLGLTAAKVERARNVLFFSCEGSDPLALTPARILADDATAQDVLDAFQRGPSDSEVAAGFTPGSWGVPSRVVTEKVDGVFIVDLLSDQAPGFLGSEMGPKPLLESLGRQAGVTRVSLLIQHVPQCRRDDLCA
jgi:hypothetical protein